MKEIMICVKFWKFINSKFYLFGQPMYVFFWLKGWSNFWEQLFWSLSFFLSKLISKLSNHFYIGVWTFCLSKLILICILIISFFFVIKFSKKSAFVITLCDYNERFVKVVRHCSCKWIVSFIIQNVRKSILHIYALQMACLFLWKVGRILL